MTGGFYMDEDIEKEILKCEEEIKKAWKKEEFFIISYFISIIATIYISYRLLGDGYLSDYLAEKWWLNLIIIIVLTIISLKVSSPYYDKRKAAMQKKFELQNKKSIELEDKRYTRYLNAYKRDCSKYSKFKSYKGLKIGVLDGHFMIISLTPPKEPQHKDDGMNIKLINAVKHVLDIHLDVPLKDFIYFKKEGSVQYTTEVSGGGTSLGGAIIGGVIAGGAGAIIGSRKSVKSKTVEHDNRVTIIKTRKGEYTGEADLYKVLMKVVPEKELTQLLVTGNENNNSAISNSDAATLQENTSSNK